MTLKTQLGQKCTLYFSDLDNQRSKPSDVGIKKVDFKRSYFQKKNFKKLAKNTEKK